MAVVLIDNYDSFTYNIRQYLTYAGGKITKICQYHQIPETDFERYSGIIISPGPGLPHNYPLLKKLILQYEGKIPILGICLGHQAIATCYGAKLSHLRKPLHGETSNIRKVNSSSILFDNFPETFQGGRYHSWYVSGQNFPECLEITTTLQDGTIMGICHKIHPVEGIQFHPESIMTPDGVELFRNWLNSLPQA